MAAPYHLLLVAATELETSRLREALKLQPQSAQHWGTQLPQAHVSLLHTGIGMVNTAFRLGQFLAKHAVQRGINFGIAGSFDRSLALGQVVEVVEDSFSELGAESPEGFIDLESMGFPLLDLPKAPLYNRLSNPQPDANDLPKVSAITVNQVHGLDAHAQQTREAWNCQVESMEGAAFFHAMLIAEIPFFAYRSISNYVETRDKSRWDIPLAARNVQDFVAQKVHQIIERLPNSY